MGNRVLWLFCARVSAFAIILAAFIPSARGDTTYQYTGNAFQSWTGPSCLGQCSITGGLTLVDALPANLSSDLPIGASQLVTFTFTDGEQSWTYNPVNLANQPNNINPPAVFGNIDILGTDASGDITGWGVGVYTCLSADCNNFDVLDTASVPSPFGGPSGFQYDIWGNNNGLASCSAANRGLAGYCAFNVNDPGTWTITPEPSTTTSFAIGALLIVIFSYARRSSLKIRSVLIRLSIFLIILTAFALSAHADTTYEYTGNPFQYEYGAISCLPQCAMAISGSITLNAPLPTSAENFDFTSRLVTFAFNGLTYIPGNDGVRAYGYFSTDALGDISSWFIGVFVEAGGAEPYDRLDTYGNLGTGIGGDSWNVENLPGPYGIACRPFIGDLAGYCAFNINDPGNWTVVPEPSTFMSFAFGLIATLVSAGARKFRIA